ncbi:hypothetical protein PENTCL1PPCAC_19803, partial [Pristionchus entomophagus]
SLGWEDINHPWLTLWLQLHVYLVVLDECIDRLEEEAFVLGVHSSREEATLVLHHRLDRNVSGGVLGGAVHDVEREVGVQRVEVAAPAESMVHLEVGGARHDALGLIGRLDADVHLDGGAAATARLAAAADDALLLTRRRRRAALVAVSFAARIAVVLVDGGGVGAGGVGTRGHRTSVRRLGAFRLLALSGGAATVQIGQMQTLEGGREVALNGGGA